MTTPFLLTLFYFIAETTSTPDFKENISFPSQDTFITNYDLGFVEPKILNTTQIKDKVVINLKPFYSVHSQKSSKMFGSFENRYLFKQDPISASVKTSQDLQGNKQAKASIKTKFYNDRYQVKFNTEIKEDKKGEKTGSAAVSAKFSFGS